MVESVREVCGSVRVGGERTQRVCCGIEVKAAVRRKEAAWVDVLAANEDAKERYMEA